MPSPLRDPDTVRASDAPLQVLLDRKAREFPDTLAFRFLTDGESAERTVTFAQLSANARATAGRLVDVGASGQPVLLLQPPGIEFIEGLFACWYAGAIAVPAYPPRGKRHRDRLRAIRGDTGARFALGPLPGDSDLITVSGDADGNEERELDIPYPGLHAPCLLQYTSGSTSAPKGVMISHRNFRSHFRSLGFYEDLQIRSALSWLPPYHDMGLVLKILYAFEAGIPLTMFSPEHFLQRPARWLRAIDRYRAELSGAPNFAFEMCLRSIRDEEIEGLDLSCWKAAPCGAERIRLETLDRFAERFARYGFRREAFLPGYGLAETTLIATAHPPGSSPMISEHPDSGKLVSSGVPLCGVDLRIADLSDNTTCGEREIGEIRIKGSIVASGYWNQAEATHESFGPKSDSELRTGDLGYLQDGHLFVTGRIKDLIIIDGVNHAAEDIEAAAHSGSPEITSVAAFAVEAAGQESIAVVAEAEGLAPELRSSVCNRIRQSVADGMELPVHRVILVRTGLLPRTTSGKIRRATCREMLEDGRLAILHENRAELIPDPDEIPLLSVVLDAVIEVTGRTGVRATDHVVGYGMGSLDATRLMALLNARTGRQLTIGDVYTAESFQCLAHRLGSAAPQEHQVLSSINGTIDPSNPLTHAQERMWYLHQFNPASAAYHVFGAIKLKGDPDIDALKAAFKDVVSRHDILLSRHASSAGRPSVRIETENVAELEIDATSDEESLRSHLTAFARQPFDLAHDSPIRATMVACGGNRHILAVCAHHIAADGWSLRILARELAESYANIRSGTTTHSAASASYLAYGTLHREWIDSGAVDKQIAYWKRRLAGHSGVLNLPTDFPRPQRPSSDGGLVAIDLPADLCSRVDALARSHRSSPFMVHLAALLLLLRQHGGGNDPVVAVPVANRNHAASADLVGTLVNTLPFRMPLETDEPFADLLDRVRTATLEMLENQDAPFERIIQEIQPERSANHSPIAQVMFDHQEIPLTSTWAGGLTCRPYLAHRGAAQFDLSLLLTAYGDSQQLALEYRMDLFREDTVKSMLDRHLANLEAICGNANLSPSATIRLTDADRFWLEQVSKGPERPAFMGRNTPSLIAVRVEAHPHRIAVSAAGTALTYQELQSGSDRLASILRARGVKPGDRVALLLERTVELPLTLLAIWKAGAAYVPMDRANPAERLRLILEDQSPVHVIVSRDLVSHLPPVQPHWLIEELESENPQSTGFHDILPEQPAYVIHTSGSTGKPKGVVVSHGALANFLLSMAETPGFTEADRLLAVTTVSFDISTLELFLPLVTGGSLELVTTDVARDGNELMDRLDSREITVMQATPATWRLLIDAGWMGNPDLKILCGGEALDIHLASELVRRGCQVWNLYGPTETTVWSTHWRVPAEPRHVRIGTPVANTGVHVLSEAGELLPPGVPGALWISGAGLADGYWQLGELTEERFRDIHSADGTTIRAYQTGDIARWHADGTLECMGRSDGQVKIRGYRVELGEIESVIVSHPLVAQAKVALRGNSPAAERLVAWITPIAGEGFPDGAEIRSYLTARLPHYMLPADIGMIQAFPLNSSGKVDTLRLADPQPVSRIESEATETERKLMDLWCELLDRKSLHPDDNWFHVGGHSLLALRLFARIHQELGRSLPLSSILDHPTPRQLAQLVDSTPTDPRP